jgi:hypothetical protein
VRLLGGKRPKFDRQKPQTLIAVATIQTVSSS